MIHYKSGNYDGRKINDRFPFDVPTLTVKRAGDIKINVKT